MKTSNYMDDRVKEPRDCSIEVQLLHCLLIDEQNEPLEELLYKARILHYKGVGPKGSPMIDLGPRPGGCNRCCHLAHRLA